MTTFTEVADRVWVTRLDWFDVNVTVVGGEEGLLVVDTFASTAAAAPVLEAVRRLGGPIRWAVNTHHHFDHTFGNAVFAEAGAELVAHEDVAQTLQSHAEDTQRRVKEQLATEPDEPDGRWAALAETEIVVPTRTFSSVMVLDLGDRTVDLVHPGRGHTGGDCVLRVSDADVLIAGDLVEQANNATPGFGDDCYPMEWPLTLDVVLQLLTPSSVVVPGHGDPVDREFVEEQRNDIGILAETIRDLAGRGVPVDRAVAEAERWPFSDAAVAGAVRRAYEHLPRSQKRLPLI